jgi:hypothetical protein
MVSLKKVNDRTVDETDSREGKVTDEIRLAAASDGTTIRVIDNDVLHPPTNHELHAEEAAAARVARNTGSLLMPRRFGPTHVCVDD